jgi:transposase
MSEPTPAAPTEVPQPPRCRAATRAAWVERLARFSHSDLPPAQFCAAEGVSLPSFYAWKRRLAAEALGPATPPSPGHEHGPRLLPVSVQPAAVTLELVLPGGALLRLAPGCDLAWVRSVVQTLGGLSC